MSLLHLQNVPKSIMSDELWSTVCMLTSLKKIIELYGSLYILEFIVHTHFNVCLHSESVLLHTDKFCQVPRL